jgi:hypothetical protein
VIASRRFSLLGTLIERAFVDLIESALGRFGRCLSRGRLLSLLAMFAPVSGIIRRAATNLSLSLSLVSGEASIPIDPA